MKVRIFAVLALLSTSAFAGDAVTVHEPSPRAVTQGSAQLDFHVNVELQVGLFAWKRVVDKPVDLSAVEGPDPTQLSLPFKGEPYTPVLSFRVLKLRDRLWVMWITRQDTVNGQPVGNSVTKHVTFCQGEARSVDLDGFYNLQFRTLRLTTWF